MRAYIMLFQDITNRIHDSTIIAQWSLENLNRLTRLSFREYKSPHRIPMKIEQETLDKTLRGSSLCDRLPFNAASSSAAALLQNTGKVFLFLRGSKREKPVTVFVTKLNRRSVSFVSEIKELDFPTRHRVQVSNKW